MSFQWSVTPTRAWPALTDSYTAAIRRGVRAIARRRAPEIEAWMKTNAAWTDQTGNARQSLHTEVREVGESMVEIILEHGVDYGIFLELAHGGRFQVIGPALDVFGPQVWQDVQAMLR